jgi:methionine-gamma-lyase
MKPKNIKTETQLIHAGVLNNACNAQNSPIYRTSTFVFENADQGAQRFLGKEDGFIYSRLGNPTNRELEVKLACLEKSEDCAVTSSGMGAIASCM